MSKSKEPRRKAAEAAVEPVLPAPAWPVDFAPVRTAVFMAGGCAVLGAMLFLAALFGAMGPVKIALASVLGMYNPAMVSDSGFDLAVAVWGLGAILLGGVVHPSIGIAVLVLFRPWIDGYTFPMDNLYFVSGVFILTTFWAVRVLLRGGKIRGLGWALPLALYLLVALAGLGGTWEFAATCRQLLLWFSYLMLFVLALNSATSRAASGIMIGGLCAAMGLEALFAILHYEFLLPFLRELVKNPAVLQKYFGTSTITPELARRFSINRAFGSVLFPNSLAAYLLLGMPVLAAGARLAWLRLRETAGETGRAAHPRAAGAAAVAAWLATLALAMFVLHFPSVYRVDEGAVPWYFRLGFMFTFAALLGLAPAAWIYFTSLRRGLLRCGRLLAAWLLSAALLFAAWALLVTYSRGAWLGLLAAGLWAALLLWGGNTIRARLVRLVPALATVALVLTAAFGWSRVMTADAAWAQQAKPAQSADAGADDGPRSTRVTQQGRAVEAKDLIDPASFRVRLTYWRVALSIIAHHPLAGVGLGNFAVAYGHYQYLGAGDVREAHSGFLQAVCETGIPGGLLFALFWAAILLGGAFNVLRAPTRRARLWLLALHAGLMAFCLHAAIDINFSHPSLVMTAMVVAGISLGWRPGGDLSDTPAAAGGMLHRAVAAVMLVLIALAAGLVARIWVQELTLSRLTFANASEEQEIFRRFRAARFFVEDVAKYMRQTEAGTGGAKPPQFPFREAVNLNPDPARWAGTGDFFAPDPDNPRGFRRLNAGDPVTMDSVMMIRKPRLAWLTAIDGMLGWLVEMEAVDSRFPHNPDMAVHIARMYELLAREVPGRKYLMARSLWLTGWYDWARTALDRSPMSAEMHEFYAQTLVYRARNDSPYAPLPVIEEAVAHAQTAVDYSPLLPAYRQFLARTLEDMARMQEKAGDTARAGETRQRAGQVKKEAEELQQRRWQLGIDY